MKAKIESIKITIETDKGTLEREFKSLDEVVEFVGSLHPKLKKVARHAADFGRVVHTGISIARMINEFKK